MEWSKIEEWPAGPGARLRLRVPPDPHVGRLVREQIVAFTKTLELCDADLIEFLTAVGEALANAIEHSGASEPIEVDVSLVRADRLVATVVDRGIGFEPTARAVSEPGLPDGLAERGRGLPIMRSCSDIFSVESAPGKGTTVTVGRSLRPADPAPLRRAG